MQKFLGGSVEIVSGEYRITVDPLPYIVWLDHTLKRAADKDGPVWFGVLCSLTVTNIEGPGFGDTDEKIKLKRVNLGPCERWLVPFEVFNKLPHSVQLDVWLHMNEIHDFVEADSKN